MYKYKSLFDLWKVSCEKYSDLIAFSDNKMSEKITFKEAFRRLCYLAETFQKMGIKRFDKISLFAVNSVNWLIIEQAFITLGATVVSKSSDTVLNELNYVYNNSDSVVLVTDNKNVIKFLDENNNNFFQKLKFIIYIGNESNTDNVKFPPPTHNEKIYILSEILSKLKPDTVLKSNWEENPDDIAYINYTSGTSSSPKGAMLPNIGMSYVVEQLQKFNDFKSNKFFVGAFPLSSAGAKSVNLLCFSRGCTNIFTPYSEFYDVLLKYQPDYFELAPKIIQTIHSKIMSSIKKEGILFEKIFRFSYSLMDLILHIERYIFSYFKLKNCLKYIKKILDKIIFKKIRNTLLKDDAVLCIGSAHLAKPLENFLNIMNIKFVQHYGMTETTGLAVSNTLESQQLHPFSVGIPFDGTQLKIINPETKEELQNGEIGLILLKGPEILLKYYKNEEATQKAILNDNYLNTGDLGYVDKQGYLYVLSRYDDVIVLSNGYNVYTPILENETKDSEYINQIAICGHGKPYLSALIVLNYSIYQNWCQCNSINIINPNNNDAFKKFLIEHLNEKIIRKDNYKYYEKLKNIYFLKDKFTCENGMLTATLKIKYKKIINTYQNEINSMYKDIIK